MTRRILCLLLTLPSANPEHLQAALDEGLGGCFDGEATCLLQKGAEALKPRVTKAQARQVLLDVDSHADTAPPGVESLNSVRPSVYEVAAVAVTYFVVYAILAVVHAFNQAQDNSDRPLEKALESAVMGVCFAPMLCVLFLCVYKRADSLAEGEPAKYDLPPAYVLNALPVCSVAFAVQMALYVIREWTINKAAKGARLPASSFWNTLFNFAMLAMYAAAGFIIVGLISMVQPAELVQAEGPLDISTGIFCSNCLVVLYFAVYAALHIAKSLDIWHLGRGNDPESLEDPFRYVMEVLKIAASTMQLAPMLSSLFIAVQLTVDGANEVLPGLVETCMYLCSFLLFLQVAVAIITPFATKAELQAAPGRPDIVDFITDRPRLFMLLSIVRAVSMCTMYIGICVVCSHLWRQTDEPVWVILVTHLATYYFLVYLLLWLAVTVRLISDAGMSVNMRTLTTAKDAVAVCPMLAVLFMESWVKASSIKTETGKIGQPQGYAQDYMFVATYALLLQLVLCLANGLVFTLPQDSKVMRSCGTWIRAGLASISAGFYLSMVTVYTCTLMVLVSLFTNSPKAATGAGAWFY